MKKTLKEQLERIHTITYGEKRTLHENFIDDLLGKVGIGDKKIDDPKKADLVTTDVNDFFQSLEKAASSGLSQQSYGGMAYQKEVESMQIGLTLLGYELPKYGVDGLFGPETAAAVSKFNSDNSILNESSQQVRTTLQNLGYKEKGSEISSGGEVIDQISDIVSNVLKDFKSIKPNVSVTVTAGNDNFHHGLNYVSKHTQGKAIDLVLNPYNSENANAFLSILNKYKQKDTNFSYIDEYTNPSGAATGGHFHLQYGAGQSASGGGGKMTSASPEMLNKLIELLKQRGVKPEELKQMIDTVSTGGSPEFTDIDLKTDEGYTKYATICQKFIDSRKPNPLGITGEMMAKAAKNAFERFNKFVPAELALAQLAVEGGVGNGDVNSRPIRTKNPFNVGNVDNGSNKFESSVEDGIQAYYDLIARSYLGKGRTAKDLVTNFVNKEDQRYASGQDYEKALNQIIPQINRIEQSVSPKTV
jgi:peptidoglycan hydrolase-like protein with peptidoglycan-binding domain